MLNYFESHAHYDDKRFNSDRDRLLSSLPSLGVCTIINSGADMHSSRQGLKLAEKYPHVYFAAGVHPHDAKSMTEADIAELETLLGHPKAVALGEIGLDFHYDNSPRNVQRRWFIKQLELAKKVNKPVIIHSRDAAQECFDIISRSGVSSGVIHCYSGSPEMALAYIQMGFYIGIGGVITYKNSKKLVEVAEKIPLERILIETDCPYLSPEPNRGKRNDSSNLKYVVEKLAEIKNLPPESIADITKLNAENLFFKKSVA